MSPRKHVATNAFKVYSGGSLSLHPGHPPQSPWVRAGLGSARPSGAWTLSDHRVLGDGQPASAAGRGGPWRHGRFVAVLRGSRRWPPDRLQSALRPTSPPRHQRPTGCPRSRGRRERVPSAHGRARVLRGTPPSARRRLHRTHLHRGRRVRDVLRDDLIDDLCDDLSDDLIDDLIDDLSEILKEIKQVI